MLFYVGENVAWWDMFYFSFCRKLFKKITDMVFKQRVTSNSFLLFDTNVSYSLIIKT